MDILTSSFNTIQQILNENYGVNALITDADTMTIISLAITRTELFINDVIDVQTINEILEKPVNDVVSSLECICIMRPTKENIDLLSEEISHKSHYSKYSIYFTNVVIEQQIKQLGLSDMNHLIERIDEVYLDYFPLNDKLFSLNIPNIFEIRRNGSPDFLIRKISDGILSALYSLQVRPLIRFSSNSFYCKQIAKDLLNKLSLNSYDNVSDDTVLLIVDRLTDPISALIHPWFYLGAIHDIFGIHNNFVALPKNTIVLNERHDNFLKNYGCKFLGDVGPAVHEKSKEAKRLNDSTKKTINNPNQISEIVNTATQLQEQYRILENHLSLASSINDKVANENLISIGDVEQSIVNCDDDPAIHLNEILSLKDKENISFDDITRLVLLFSLKYEGRAQEQFNTLKTVFPDLTHLISATLKVAGSSKRGPENIFSSKSKLTQFFSDIKALYDANSRLLDQYNCNLVSIIERVKKGQLSPETYPFIDGKRAEFLKPKRLIVFYLGGATYYELKAAKESTDIDVLIGGTCIHNASSFIKNEIQPFSY